MRCATGQLAELSYTVGDHGITLKDYWPKTKREAADLVLQIFERNRWEEHNRAVYMRMKGVEPKPVEELSVEELRTLVNSFWKNRMAIFFDPPTQEE